MKTVCLFAGARKGANPKYLEVASELGGWIAEKKLDLIYGGSFVGCMGRVAFEALSGGANVTGIIPYYWKDLVDKEETRIEVIVTSDLFERKRLMIEKSDFFVALPGGFGTIDELFEVLTLNQINQMSKPIYLINTEGYFEPLMDLLNHCAQNDFLTLDEINRTVHLVESFGEIRL